MVVGRGEYTWYCFVTQAAEDDDAAVVHIRSMWGALLRQGEWNVNACLPVLLWRPSSAQQPHQKNVTQLPDCWKAAEERKSHITLWLLLLASVQFDGIDSEGAWTEGFDQV